MFRKIFSITFLLLLLCKLSYGGLIDDYIKDRIKKSSEEVDEFYKIPEKSSVSIFSLGGCRLGFCSGVVVKETANYSYVLTCKHCINVTVELYAENNKVESIFCTTDEDLAYLKVKGKIKDKVPAKLSEYGTIIKDRVFLVGYPNFKIYKREGIVIKKTNDWVWMEMKVIGGCSGGGIFNEQSELTGIVWGGLDSRRNKIGVFEGLYDIKRFLKKTNYYEN